MEEMRNYLATTFYYCSQSLLYWRTTWSIFYREHVQPPSLGGITHEDWQGGCGWCFHQRRRVEWSHVDHGWGGQHAAGYGSSPCQPSSRWGLVVGRIPQWSAAEGWCPADGSFFIPIVECPKQRWDTAPGESDREDHSMSQQSGDEESVREDENPNDDQHAKSTSSCSGSSNCYRTWRAVSSWRANQRQPRTLTWKQKQWKRNSEQWQYHFEQWNYQEHNWRWKWQNWTVNGWGKSMLATCNSCSTRTRSALWRVGWPRSSWKSLSRDRKLWGNGIFNLKRCNQRMWQLWWMQSGDAKA